MKIDFIGLTEKKQSDGKPWLCFEYRVTIGKETTEYFTGIGHIEKHKGYKNKEGLKIFHVPKEHGGEFACVFKPFGTIYAGDIQSIVYRKEPKPSDVAECLISDIDAGSMSFDDFCDNYGYSNDSLKALDTYRACMETARKFKRSELFQYLTDEQKENYA